MESGKKNQHFVPGKSKIPAAPISRGTGLNISNFFFFGLIEELNGRRSNPHIRWPKLASASWSRRRPLLSFGQSGRLNHHQQQSRPQTWVIRKALHKNWSTVKGRSKLNASAHKRAAQRTTLAPPRSKYRTCDKKYRWQNN